ncbi:Pleckstrin likey domain-containing family M member 3 [Spatholobus suberectus]|nr:Pleckstrin likey domain-containing family M member 3 [Spatholobus suberectus]
MAEAKLVHRIRWIRSLRYGFANRTVRRPLFVRRRFRVRALLQRQLGDGNAQHRREPVQRRHAVPRFPRLRFRVYGGPREFQSGKRNGGYESRRRRPEAESEVRFQWIGAVRVQWDNEVTVGEGGGNGIELEIGIREEEEQQQEEDEEEEELSEGDDSMYNYGSDGDGGNETYLSSRSIGYYEEPEVEKENPLFLNSSVAFGSRDLDDFLLQSEEVRDRGVDMLANLEEISPSIDCQKSVETQVQGSDDLVSCPKTSSVAKVDEVDVDLPAREAPRNVGLDVTDGGSVENRNAKQ